MPPNGLRTKLLRIGEIFYLVLLVVSFYLLFLSRSGEVHTVWEAMHPAFIPVFFVATSLLAVILLSSEEVTHRLLLVIAHSILTHSFFSIILPAGDLSGQQIDLGRIRLIYDNAVLHGLPLSTTQTIDSLIIQRFGGINFQAALSVIFARMLNIDVLWVHLFLVPVLWGTLTPIAAYQTTYSLTQNSKAAVLSGLLFSAFPYATYFGSISVSNSLGFIFFFFSLCFMLKYLSSNDSSATFLMLVFSFFSFFSHYLTGIMSVSILLLAFALKAHKNRKRKAASTRTCGDRFSLAVFFLVSITLLPLSLFYLRFLRPSTQVVFTLGKFSGMPLGEIVGLTLVGELVHGFDLKTVLLVIIGPTLALFLMIYQLFRSRRNPASDHQTSFHFLFAAFLTMVIDYRILKLFMEGLPFNEERLWVFRDFIAAPLVALAVYAVVSLVKIYPNAESSPTIAVANPKKLAKGNILHALSALLALNILIPILLGGWMTLSLSAAYPQVAPLQTTWYELEAVKYIEENTKIKYVVIGDIWTIFAGEVIVGINNPRAYYFGEYNKTGYDLFLNMREDPSPQWMLLAMNYTHTTIAYFIVTEPRLGTEGFNNVVSSALGNGQLTLVGVFGTGKLYVFSFRKG